MSAARPERPPNVDVDEGDLSASPEPEPSVSL
jgi:hypothetical protein